MPPTLAKQLSEEGKLAARERHRRLTGLLRQTGLGQSALHRWLTKNVDSEIALSTVQSWARGLDTGGPISELTWRGILASFGLPPTWEPGQAVPGWVDEAAPTPGSLLAKAREKSKAKAKRGTLQ